jgi:alanyl-tRNA synthetase
MTNCTERVYQSDPYISEFTATVTNVNGDWVTLDRSAFYPGGGGQDPDMGEMDRMKVVEVKHQGEEIAHKVPGNSFKVGQKISGRVDFPRRLDLMRGHTGEHLLFSSLNRLVPELDLVKIAITPSKKSLIVKGGLDLMMILEAERFVNDVISEGVEIHEEIVGRDDPLVCEARVKLDRIPGSKIRLVRIGKYDLAACAGVHVHNTSEIGMLLVEKLTSAKPQGDFEIEFSVGPSAVQRALHLSTIALQMSELLGARPEDAMRALQNQKGDLDRARDSLKAMAKRSIEELEPEQAGGAPFYNMIVKGLDRRTLSEEATKKVEDGHSLCILVDEGERISVFIAAGKNSKFDASALLKEVLGSIGGKGGGNRSFATGGISADVTAMEVMDVAKKIVDKTNV